jgi:transposase
MSELAPDKRQSLVYIPARYEIHEVIVHNYKCDACEENQFKSAKMPPALLPKSIVTPELGAYIVTQKVDARTPLYMLARLLKYDGVTLSRQVLANWFLKLGEMVESFYMFLITLLSALELIHADETTLKVIDDNERVKSYMWVYRSGDYAETPLILYHYGGDETDVKTKETTGGRGACNPKAVLGDYSGRLVADGYSSYKTFDKNHGGKATLSGCWSHARRKFADALIAGGFSLDKLDKIPCETPALKGFLYCEKLFGIEREIASLSPDDKLAIRNEKSKPVVEAFFAWAKTVPCEGKLAKAIGYAVNQEQYLTAFLTDGRIPLSNNLAEQAIKPFVQGRKSWLFCDSKHGAKITAIFYSLVETAKVNNLIPYEYLKYLFEKFQNRNFNADYSDLLPWNPSLPAHLKVK